MNLSLNWLNDYVAIDKISLPDMVSGLTMSGSKVEKAKDLSEPLCKIVVGKVAQIKKHEDSDKLWICQLDVGGREVQIVTGAQNVTEGSIVPVVLDGGTVLNRQDGSVTKIKKGKLRGEVSEGMLCSPDELGLDKSDVPYADEDGILILSNDPERSKLQVGGNALEFLGLSDTVLEFEITNNRPDCFSVTGLAREVAATFDLPLDVPAPHYKGINHDINSEVRVTVENSELCSRYMAGFAKNVKIAPSPRWLTSRLKAHGIRPINNIVDITNYVMLEYGHPLHAFDKRQVEDGQIIVRNAAKHEQITLLDGNTVTLDTDTLVIADASKPMAVAGVMGGEFSGVADDTTEVIFEAACFDGVSVRRASKKIGRRTESSSRFEKGLNPVNVKAALLRALQLVEELGIGEVADTNIDVQHFTETKSLVSHDCDFVNKSLGANISQEEQIAIFRRLGLGYEDGNVIVPSHRSDINLPCDLVEEVARIYGYNNIAPTLPPNAVKGLYEHSVRKIADVLTAQGCNECITYSFVSPRMTSGDMVGIRNPFGEETSVMRTSLWASMLKVIGDNLNAGNTEGRLFELGRTYAPDGETDKLCIGLYGKDEDYYTLKGIFEELLAAFKIRISIKRYTDAPWHPGRAAACDYACMGEISPLVLRDYGISERVYVAEIDLEAFMSKICDKTKYKPIPKYPASVRDLSLVCEEDTASGNIVEMIEKSGKNLLERVDFFDVFRGGNLTEGTKSLSYKLTFRKADGTLTDAEVDTAVEKILGKLQESNIKLRS